MKMELKSQIRSSGKKFPPERGKYLFGLCGNWTRISIIGYTTHRLKTRRFLTTVSERQ